MKTYRILNCECGCEFSTKIWADEKSTNSTCVKCGKRLSEETINYMTKEIYKVD